jgi:1,4-alpha-glucan branching enzyme
MFYMKNKLGAWQVGEDKDKGKVEFKVFFPKNFDPKIASIRVAGDFQSQISPNANWDFPHGFELTREDKEEGAFWRHATQTELKAGYYQYKYLVTFTDGTARIVSDPCARYGGTDNQNAAFVIGGSTADENKVQPLAGGRKHLRDLIVYELMIDDFTDEDRGPRAPLAVVMDERKLKYLKDLGFNAILFMPWTAWKNRDFDWGYEPFQYFAVEYRYANDLEQPAEKISWLKRLISACHEQGIHVIMDGVFNHVSMDFPYKWMYRNPEDCPFVGTFGGSFAGLQDLNFNNDCTNEFVRDVCLYWIETFGIDGIRFDNTVNFYVAGNPKGLPELMEEIQTHLGPQQAKSFSLTLEHIDPSAADVTNTTRATSYWDNALYGQTFDALWSNQIRPGFLNSLNDQRFLTTTEKVPTIYLSNHDHAHVTWQAGARANLGSMQWFRTQPYVIALYTSPATPLVPNGQEYGEDYWIMENDEGTGRRVNPRPLRWKRSKDRIGQSLLKLYTRMAEIRTQYPGLRSANFYPQPWEQWQTQFNPQGYGIDSARQLAIYHRWGHDGQGILQRFIIVLNFSDMPQDVSVPFPENGEWVDLLSDYCGSWKPVVTNYRLTFQVNSNWGHVFYK